MSFSIPNANPSNPIRRIAISTGGGDAPGLNAVIRAVVLAALQRGWECFGIREGFNGILRPDRFPIDGVFAISKDQVRGINHLGGTILGTTNHGNPMRFVMKNADGSEYEVDRTDDIIQHLRAKGIDALICIGGDGTLTIAHALHQRGLAQGLRVIGVPKTIDNDLAATDVTFGFQTAVQIATDSFDRLVTTAESHHRCMIMEVMGRDAGWIALHTAIAGGAEICLIPEIPYDVHKLAKRVSSRYKNGKGFCNIVIAEGAKPKDGTIVSQKGEKGSEHVRLGGVAFQLSKQLKDAGCKAEIRETVLGHTQRGGTPVAYDRVLASLYGVKAFELALESKFGHMVAFKNNEIVAVSLEEATRGNHVVNKNDYLVKAAKGLGISFGD